MNSDTSKTLSIKETSDISVKEEEILEKESESTIISN